MQHIAPAESNKDERSSGLARERADGVRENPGKRIKLGKAPFFSMRQPNARELPARVGREEVAIRRPDMGDGGRAGSAAQHKLIAHELAVVFTQLSRQRSITRVG